MVDEKPWRIALAKFEAFRENAPTYFREETVEQYNEIVAALEAASGESFDEFKIAADKVKPKITSARPGGYGGGRGSVTYSKDKYCDPAYFNSQSDGLWGYLESFQPEATTSNKPRMKGQAPASQIHIEPAYGSSVSVADGVRDQAKARRVWVVHGRDDRLRRGLFDFLRSIGLEPLEFSEARKRTGKPMPYIGEILDAAFQHAQAVVVLLTPDDEARLRTDLQKDGDPDHERVLCGQARPNVLFEAGMALVSHPDRTILVQIGNVRPFSDVAGRHIVHMDDSTEKRQELASRLEDAGCPANLVGTDWHKAGDMKPPANFVVPQSKSAAIVAEDPARPMIEKEVLADLISELEDNLERAKVRRIGDVYSRPSVDVWTKNRNRLVLPTELRSTVATIYRQIDEWLTVVQSGVHPNMGSPALDGTTASLKGQLPTVIEELKKLL